MTFRLSRRSLARLGGVHPDLVLVVKRAIEISAVDFSVTEGLRSREKQAQAVAAGKSQTMNSLHLVQADGWGHAIDVCALQAGKPVWDWGPYERIADAFMQAGAELGVPIVWGGSWTTLKDGCHFELNRKFYSQAKQKGNT